MASRIVIDNVSAGYGSVRVLHGVSTRVEAGETVVLLGTNGNGKSTLIKIAAGVYDFEEGRYSIAGKPAAIRDPRQALDEGIAVVYQELELVLSLSVVGKGQDVVAMKDGDGLTLLHWAAREGHLDMVKYLVFEANADVLQRCNRQLKPAQHAREQW